MSGRAHLLRGFCSYALWFPLQFVFRFSPRLIASCAALSRQQAERLGRLSD